MQRAKNLTAEEPGNFIHIVRGNKIIRVKKREITMMQRTTPETEHFELWFGNVDTLNPEKFIELQTLIHQTNLLPHVIALTEAKPKNSVNIWNPIWHKLDCYNLKHKNMNPDEKGRGMLLYIRKDIEYKEIDDDSGFEELQVFNLILTEGEVVIALTYRSPSPTHENNSNLNNFLRQIGSSRSRYIVLGDMNFRDIDWKYVSTNHDENSKEHHFIEAVKDSYLDQHVDRPTRVTKHNEPSLLDLLLTDKTLEPSSIEYISPLGKGDHTLLQTKFNLWTTRRSKERLNYNKGSYDELRSDLKNNLC